MASNLSSPRPGLRSLGHLPTGATPNQCTPAELVGEATKLELYSGPELFRQNHQLQPLHGALSCTSNQHAQVCVLLPQNFRDTPAYPDMRGAGSIEPLKKTRE